MNCSAISEPISTGGGFPELVHFQEKRVWLNSLYNRIFFNDLVVRHKVKNEDALRLCVRRLAESVKQGTVA